MGPLTGITVIEIAGIGPGPFCGMMLADMGAEVIRIDPKTAPGVDLRFDVLLRGRHSLAVDLKQCEDVKLVLRMIERADALLEGFRPGVMERLGLGPEESLKRNPRLIYGRMTGWGQTGPLSHLAGHDINYIALSGALHAIGACGGPPVPPLNLIGDFGGGGMLLAFGIVCGILEARLSGKGQVIDAAMTDGAALLMAPFYGLRAAGRWSNERGTNMLDSGAHFYNTYECADRKWIAVGAIEPQFYARLLEKAGVVDPTFEAQMDSSRWPELRSKLASIFKTKCRQEWCALFENCDACFAPVLDLEEAPEHPHNAVRSTFVKIDGIIQPAPAPRFSRTVPETPGASVTTGRQIEEILSEWGFSPDQIIHVKNKGTIRQQIFHLSRTATASPNELESPFSSSVMRATVVRERNKKSAAMTTQSNSPGRRLRDALTEEKPLQIVGAITAYAARMAVATGFRALYLSGGGVAANSLGMPDLGISTMEDVLVDARRILEVATLPLLVDIDTGWGGAFNIARTIRSMVGAGVAAVHIEDQVSTKRCGHRPGKEVVPAEEMTDRIKAAVDARTDSDFVLMARTDALAKEGLNSAIDRCVAYVEAGADMIFAEAVTELSMYTKFKEAVRVPILANITEFGQTPLFTKDELASAGVDMILYCCSAYRAMNAAALRVYKAIREDGTQKNVLSLMQTRAELYEFLGYQEFEERLDRLFAKQK